MDNVIFAPVDLAMRSISGSSGQGTNSVLRKEDIRDAIGNTENTGLKLAFSQLYLNIDQERINKTRGIESSEDDDFMVLKAKNDQQAYVHHMVTGISAPQNSVPEFFDGRGLTQKNH